MGTPHKHAEVIKAWADGAQIQFRYPPRYPNWADVDGNPEWYSDMEYRVKPKKVTKKRWYRTYREGNEIKVYTTDTDIWVDGLIEWPPRHSWLMPSYDYILIETEYE